MSSLLPIFVSAQNGPHAIDGGGAASESLSLVNKDQSTSSGQALAAAFSQVLREFNRTTVEKILGDLQPSKIQASPEDTLPSTTDSPLSLPSAVVATFDGFQPPARTLFQGSGFQKIGGDSTLGPVRQEYEIGKKILGIPQMPLPKPLEVGSSLYQGSLSKVVESELIPQEISQGAALKQASLALKQEDALSVRTGVPSAKEVPSGFQQVGRLVLGNETLQTPILPKVSSPLAPPQNVQSNHMSPATAIQAEGPAGFTGPNLTNQILVKSTPGNSSLLSDVAGPGIEHRTTVPAELLGGAEVLAKGGTWSNNYGDIG